MSFFLVRRSYVFHIFILLQANACSIQRKIMKKKKNVHRIFTECFNLNKISFSRYEGKCFWWHHQDGGIKWFFAHISRTVNPIALKFWWGVSDAKLFRLTRAWCRHLAKWRIWSVKLYRYSIWRKRHWLVRSVLASDNTYQTCIAIGLTAFEIRIKKMDDVPPRWWRQNKVFSSCYSGTVSATGMTVW